MNQEVVKVESLSHHFGEVTALDDVSLNVSAGSMFGLLGPDGAGKTTLLRILSTLTEPKSGNVEVLGQDPARFNRADKVQIGYMPQHFSMYPDLSVAENLRLFATVRGVPKSAQTRRRQELLEMVGMADFSKRLAGKLSGGMKQKLMLASVLMHEPDLLILDEPTTGVDPLSRYEFWELLTRLHSEGKTILVATPYMEEASHCDEIGFLAEGQLTMTGTPQQIIAAVHGVSYEIHAEDLFAVQERLIALFSSALPQAQSTPEIDQARLSSPQPGLRQVVTTALTQNALRVLVDGLTRDDLSDALNSFEVESIEPVDTDLETAFIYLAKHAGSKTQAVIA